VNRTLPFDWPYPAISPPFHPPVLGSRLIADPFSRFANPAPLGLLGFAATTFLLSLFNIQARSITTPNIILGMALAYGGLAQFVAGIEEWACGNTFGATAFASYGGFWLSFATLFIPQFGVVSESGFHFNPDDRGVRLFADLTFSAAYTSASELESAIGLYLATWG